MYSSISTCKGDISLTIKSPCYEKERSNEILLGTSGRLTDDP